MKFIRIVPHLFLLFHFFLFSTFCLAEKPKKGSGKESIARKKHLRVRTLRPLIEGNSVMFWRPQKVGSSTLLSILVSYAYRYNFLPKPQGGMNSFCRRLARCHLQSDEKAILTLEETRFLQLYINQSTPGMGIVKGSFLPHIKHTDLAVNVGKQDSNVYLTPFKMSMGHEMCNLHHSVIVKNLQCAFLPDNKEMFFSTGPQIKELFLVREPISRAISAYYFWGEIFKWVQIRNNKEQVKQIGNFSVTDKVIRGSSFTYHGNENTPPPLDIAMDYANRLPFNRGMPGPSFTWSAFADNPNDSETILLSDRIMTLVLERLDESLVVASHYLGWSLADMVVIQRRKALSAHPKAKDWPEQVIKKLEDKTNINAEYRIYDASLAKLEQRIGMLESQGIDVNFEVKLLQAIRKRAIEVCLDTEYLENYRKDIFRSGIPKYPNNKLRDVEQKYFEAGHIFSFNGQILGSFDVCGSCEAQALLVTWEKWKSQGLKLSEVSFDHAPSLVDLPKNHTIGKIEFRKCPSFIHVKHD